MITKFSLTEIDKANEFLKECGDDVTASVQIVGNAKPGEVIIQVDKNTEKASVIQSLIKAHAQMILDRITDENKKRFLMGQEIRINGQLAKKQGGTQKQEDIYQMLEQTRKQIIELDAKLYVNNHDLKALKEAIKEITDGKLDEIFI